MKAIIVQEPRKAAVADAPIPKLRPDYIKVKVVAVALNPTDWKHIDFIADAGAKVGCDFSGVVEEVGSDVKSDVKPGDRVAGLAHGSNISNHEDGCFGEYAVCKDGLFIKIPEHLSFEELSTIGVGVWTVGQGVFQSLGTPLPSEGKPSFDTLLIYGGSTATGALAIQYAKLCGLNVITTASPRNHEYVKSLGASQVFDYNSPTCGEDINKATNNTLRYAFDTIALKPSMAIIAKALTTDASSEIHYSALLPPSGFPRSDINTRFTMAYTAIGEPYTKLGRDTPAKPADYEFAVKFGKWTEQLFQEKKLVVHKPDVRSGGLEGVLQGLDDLRNDRVSGVKLVYRIDA